MVQLGRVLGFAPQPGLRIAIAVGRQLQRDVAAELAIAREIDFAHSACTEQPHDLVSPDDARRPRG